MKSHKTPNPPTFAIIDLMDRITELRCLLEQLEVLAEDLQINYFDHMQRPSNRSAFVQQRDLKIAQIKANLLHNQAIVSLDKVEELGNLAQELPR